MRIRGGVKRRSGKAVVQFCTQMGWQPDCIFQVGVGGLHEEVDVFQEVWPDVKFVGCEAHPQIVRGLHDSYPGLVLPYAITDNEGFVNLFSKSKHKDGSSLYKHINHNPRNTYTVVDNVECHTLEWVLRFHGPLGDDMLLWLDCEGSEYAALSRADKFLKKVSVVNVEMTGTPQSDGSCSPLSVHRLLHDAGFAQAWNHTNRIAIGQFDAIYVRREMLRPGLCMCLSELEATDA